MLTYQFNLLGELEMIDPIQLSHPQRWQSITLLSHYCTDL